MYVTWSWPSAFGIEEKKICNSIFDGTQFHLFNAYILYALNRKDKYYWYFIQFEEEDEAKIPPTKKLKLKLFRVWTSDTRHKHLPNFAFIEVISTCNS